MATASDMVWKYTCHGICICHRAIRIVKQVLLSVGIISTVLLLNLAPKISYTVSLLCGSIPSFCVWLRSWLSPATYPYIITIFIFILIIIILASSPQSPSPSPSSSFLEEFTLEYYSSEEVWSEVSGEEAPANTSVAAMDSGRKCTAGETEDKLESSDVVAEQNESIEATWKAIMEENGVPATRQLKKCETWDVPPPPTPCNDGISPREMRKSKTFTEARSSFSWSETHPYPKRKHEFLSQDELNTKVEEFIRKCRNKMRLERLESDQRFMDILNRGL